MAGGGCAASGRAEILGALFGLHVCESQHTLSLGIFCLGYLKVCIWRSGCKLQGLLYQWASIEVSACMTYLCLV